MKSLKEALIKKHTPYISNSNASKVKFNQIPWPREKSAYLYILYVCDDDWNTYEKLVKDHKSILTFLSGNNIAIFVGSYTHMFDLLHNTVDNSNHIFLNDTSSLWCSKESLASLAITIGESEINSHNKDDFDNKFTRLI